MNSVAWMTTGAIGSCLIAAMLEPSLAPDLLLGMLAPWVATSVTWLAVERQLARNPAGVHALLLRAFGLKLVFFAAYVVIVMQGVGVRSTAFIASFTVYFISLYCAQAFGFARVFAAQLRQAR